MLFPALDKRHNSRQRQSKNLLARRGASLDSYSNKFLISFRKELQIYSVLLEKIMKKLGVIYFEIARGVSFQFS